jgi:predicted transcriptional regulator
MQELTNLMRKNTTCVIDTMAGKLKIEKSAISLELSSNLNT